MSAATDSVEPRMVMAYVLYQVDCPDCDEVIDVGHDPVGEEVECPSCGAVLYVTETM